MVKILSLHLVLVALNLWAIRVTWIKMFLSKIQNFDFRLSHTNEGKSSTTKTENLSAEAPDASKDFTHTEAFEFSA